MAAGRRVILCKSLHKLHLIVNSVWIIGGHDNTERGYLPILANRLAAELQNLNGTGLAGLEVVVSEADEHPLRFV